MIALLLCLVPILTPGFGRTFDHFNSTLALPNPHSRQDDTVVCTPSPDGFPVFVPHPHDCTKYYECQGDWPILMECPAGLYFDPALNVCNWPEEVDCVAKCSVQLVFADIQNQKLITWSPEENCQVEQFKGFPSLQSAIPETIHQCSNGLTVIKSQGLDITQLFAYNRTLEQWELIVMPAEISDVNSYAIAAIPDVPPSFGFGLLLVGGKVDVPFFSALDIICGFNCSAYDSNRNVDGAAWTCFPQTLCTPTYDSCATSSNDFVTVVNGKNPSPVKEVGFYPAMGLPPTCVSNAVDFDDGVQDCISLQPTGPTEVYAIGTGTKKFYQMNPGEGSVKLLDIPLPVIPTQEIPARMYFDPETSTLNIIGGTIDGIIPSCITYFYEHYMWNANPSKRAPCEAGVKVLGRL